MAKNNESRWHFTVEINARGHAYVYAYQTKWNPEKHRSERTAKRHVGRLCDDGRVKVSPKFSIDFPQYATGDFYYGADKTLVDEATYRMDFPQKPGPIAEEELDETPLNDTRNIGLTWAAEQTALNHGILEDLKEVFDEETARNLLHLAIYKLDNGGSMAAYDEWRKGVYLQHSTPLAGQRISEIMAKISRQDFDNFFTRRHKRRIKIAEELKTSDPQNIQAGRLHYALDNTSISTYSRTIADAAYGCAKRDPELAQVNYTFVCDQDTGEIVFAHTYDGSITDVIALNEILYRMKAADFDLSSTVLVTDRGYSSLLNVQKMINLEIPFIQGVRVSEDVIKKNLDKYREALRDPSFYNSDLDVFARTVVEPWTQDSSYGRINKTVYQHLYNLPGGEYDATRNLIRSVTEILNLKEKGLQVPPDLWRSHGRFVQEITNDKGLKVWARNESVIKKTLQHAGCFVIRSNEESDPFKALKIYRMRGVVESDFNQFKNWVDGDRLRCTESSYLGKLFICTLATSLRLMMMKSAHDRQSVLLKIPHNSMDCLFAALRNLRADKRVTAAAWVVRTATKKQRDMLALLNLKTPPKTLQILII